MDAEAALLVIEQLGTGHPLARPFADFLTDLTNSASSAHTVRAYRGDLVQFAAHVDGTASELTAAPVRAFLSDIAGLAPSTRRRRVAGPHGIVAAAVTLGRTPGRPLRKGVGPPPHRPPRSVSD